MTTALLEPAAIEEAFEATPTELPAAATTGAIHPPHKITDIAQLPSIWRLEQNIEWLIDRLIPLGSVNLITSESGTGKTWVAYAIAGAVARGEDFAGRAVKQRPVLYLDGENPLGLVKQRLFDLGIPETNGLRVWGGWVGDAPHGPDSALLREFVRQHHPLLIWDSLIDFHDGDEQSASETRAFMKHFRVLANLGATVLILHHTGKTPASQDYRGSSDIKAAVDMAYVLESELTLAGGIHRLTLRNFKGRFAPGQDLGLKFAERRGFVACEIPAVAVDPMQVIIEIITAHPANNQAQIVKMAQAARISKHQTEKCLRDGPFDRQHGSGREILYTVAPRRTPEIPPPIEREYGNSTVPAEVET